MSKALDKALRTLDAENPFGKLLDKFETEANKALAEARNLKTPNDIRKKSDGVFRMLTQMSGEMSEMLNKFSEQKRATYNQMSKKADAVGDKMFELYEARMKEINGK